MELAEFISSTLQQILKGVSDAQKTDDGQNINATQRGDQFGGNLLNVGDFGLFTRVDFDVAVTAETKGGGKGSVKVWSIGVEGGAEKRSQVASRVVFSVPVRLPDGDKTRSEKIKDDRRREIESTQIDDDYLP